MGLTTYGDFKDQLWITSHCQMGPQGSPSAGEPLTPLLPSTAPLVTLRGEGHPSSLQLLPLHLRSTAAHGTALGTGLQKWSGLK